MVGDRRAQGWTSTPVPTEARQVICINETGSLRNLTGSLQIFKCYPLIRLIKQQPRFSSMFIGHFLFYQAMLLLLLVHQWGKVSLWLAEPAPGHSGGHISSTALNRQEFIDKEPGASWG